MGRNSVTKRAGATAGEMASRRRDIGIGTFFSNVVMYFIILTTALTLHRHGITHIETSRQAAEALRPFAGKMAETLYAVGLLGVGFLAIPTLTGSAAYAFAETFSWRQGLNKKFHRARAFYGIVILSGLLGIALDFAKVNPVRALYLSAVVNGLLAPFLLVGIAWVACDGKLMRGLPVPRLGLAAIVVAALLMAIAGVAMFLV
jgi:Mn2+/Fe2+ NRAMP family transporter